MSWENPTILRDPLSRTKQNDSPEREEREYHKVVRG